MHSLPMQLAAWLDTHNMNAHQFARQLGYSHTTVGRWLAFSHAPSATAMRAVFQATSGQVTANDLLHQEKDRARAATAA